MISTKNLTVYLNDVRVGVLTQFADGRTYLAFDTDYRTNPDRPILSLGYKNVANDVTAQDPGPVMGLPPFFSNLLPEGRLRKYLAHKAGVKETQEFKLLVALRDDLPGAVILKPETTGSSETTAEPERKWYQMPGDQALRFSLAGVQMKFSGNLTDERISIPASGIGGHWIVKLPSLSYPHVIELEYSMLALALKVGITVPDFRIVPVSKIEGMPSDVPEALEGDALISKRFDRTDEGRRTHMEDFAQVFGASDKYDIQFNYQSIANVIWQEIGLDAAVEYVRRLVHMVVIGNADMHLKNWSLIYRDGSRAKLAPAYDLVSTIVYADIEKTLPLKLSGVREFQKIDVDTFKSLAKIAGLPQRPVVNTVIEAVDALKACWGSMRNDLPIPASFVRLIEEHMQTVPLVYKRVTPIPVAEPIPVAQSWPGTFFNVQIELDDKVPAGTIVYKNQAGDAVELDAPRRMVKALIERQSHQLVAERKEFANQVIIACAGQKLYNEWRHESFIRIESRMVDGGLTEGQLREPELAMRATLFPINWRSLAAHYKAQDQSITMDFVLDNGELWTAECTVADLKKIEELPDGRRIAALRLYLRKAQRLMVIPPEEWVSFGSSRYGLSQTKYKNILKSLDSGADQEKD